MAKIDVAAVQAEANRINSDLFKLPPMYLQDEMSKIGIRQLSGIEHKDTVYNYRRKGGIVKPYKQSAGNTKDKLGSIDENVLEVHLCYAKFEDHIQDYRGKKVANMSLLGTNKTYKNPANALILFSAMKTFSEDVYDAVFFGAYDKDGASKYDLFDGYYTLMQKAVIDKKVAVNRGNLVETAPIQFPTDKNDTSAIDTVMAFLRSAHPVLIRGGAYLNVTAETAQAIAASAHNMFKYTMTYDEYGRFTIPGYPTIKVTPSALMGAGDFMFLTVDDILHFGYDSESDQEYINIKESYDNPNVLRYWVQAVYGTRVRSWDARVFCMSTGTLEAIVYAGDENDDEFTATATVHSSAGGTVKVAEVKDGKTKFYLGEYATFVATPQEGKKFSQWSDGSTNATHRVLMKKDTTLEATFVNV